MASSSSSSSIISGLGLGLSIKRKPKSKPNPNQVQVPVATNLTSSSGFVGLSLNSKRMVRFLISFSSHLPLPPTPSSTSTRLPDFRTATLQIIEDNIEKFSTVSRLIDGAGLLPPTSLKDIEKCFVALLNTQDCVGEMHEYIKNGRYGFLGPACCEHVTEIKDKCWPTLVHLNPLFPPAITSYCVRFKGPFKVPTSKTP
ncbi:Prolamin-like domain [Dillenia turbinata]|uniref:Prolamin-like domain n=1 Tax=Dillenia turbinata TaxID=194707 RepID=A0AAN8WFX5_9MAGN